MGIRYLALSIDRDDYRRISAGPCSTCGVRAHARDPDYGEPKADYLDLDKSWRFFQAILNSRDHLPARELVAGDVTHTSQGWISHQGTVAPERVRDIVADLARVTVEELHDHFQLDGAWRDERSEQDFEYVNSFLPRALSFVEGVAADDRAIVYYIG